MIDSRIPVQRVAACAVALATVFACGLTVRAQEQATDAASADDAASAGDAAGTGELGASAASELWQREGWPLVRQFCLDCHNEDVQEAELDLSGYASVERLADGAGAMQRVLEMVRFGAMPPEDAEQPTDAQRKQMTEALDQVLFSVTCDLRPRPGKVTARRLNRAEYNHSIRDLFGIDLRAADAFPSDEVGAGFDNNGDVLSLSPMLVEKYLDAAESVASQVLVDPASLPRLERDVPSDQLLIHGETRTGRFNGRFLAPDAYVWADFEVPYDGEYRVRISGGNAERDSEPTTVAVFDEQGILRGKNEMGYYGGSGSSQSFDFRVELQKGSRRFFVQPIQGKAELTIGETRFAALPGFNDEVIAAAKEAVAQPLKPDRQIDDAAFPFMIRRIKVEGPTRYPDEAFPPSQSQLVRKVARSSGGKWQEVESAAIECLRPLMRRAFRHEVSEEEVRPYAQLVRQATDRGESYYRGLQIAVSAVLVSPRFLFRVETPPEGWAAEEDGTIALTPHQLATRLSYFLWSSLPDESLLRDAAEAKLDQPNLERHVTRMLADPKANALAEQFASQWLGLRNLDAHEADTERFQTFTPSLREAMAGETQSLFMHLLRENRPVTELLTADYTFVNEELAGHYGIDGIEGDHFQKVSLQATPRRGLLAHASVLTLTSNPGRTSPVKRGKWILENVLGTPPPEPPAGVPPLEETQTAGADATLREQMEIHRTDPSCAACHRVMDGLGFGLEQYDAIGRFRQTEGKLPIDASGELPGGRSFRGASELSEILGKTEAESFARTAVHRMLTFALGRQLTPADRCTVDAIVEKTAENGYRIQDLILEVVRSRPFRYYEWSGPAGAPEQS